MGVLENIKHEAFAQNLCAGMTQRQAYMAVYPKSQTWKPESVDQNACHLYKRPEVFARVRELKDEAAMRSVMTRAERMVALSNMAKDEDLYVKARVAAINELNKMDGSYERKKLDVTVNADISDIASKVEAILDE
jgi:hypothetical protein